METDHLRNLLNRAIHKLPADLKTVLILRYGLQDGNRQSVGKISRQLNAKASRIARMEIKAIRQLRRPKICAPLFEALDAVDPVIWHEIAEEISEAGSLVRKSDNYDTPMQNLPGEISLAIKCRYSSLGKWIECNAVENENLWFRSKHPPETVKDKVGQLAGIWNRDTTPLLVCSLLSELQVDVAFLRFLLALSPWVSGFYGGYVALRPISSVELRAIRLHLLFLYKYAASPIPLEQVVEDCNTLYHDDQLNAAITETIMKSKSHLFLETGDQAWSGLGSAREHAPYTETDDVAPEDDGALSGANREKPPFVYERPWSETTASVIVREIVEERGLCRQQSIIRLFGARTEGRYQIVNAVVSLDLDEDFLEVAPRVYGLRKVYGNIDPLKGWSDILLTREACKIFVTERYAGEPLNAYPFWTPAMEEQWCFWAARNSELNFGIGLGGRSDRAFNRKLFQSLLFVSDPERWSVSESLKKQWLFKKQALSEYHFAKPVPHPIWQRIPSLQDLFSVAMTSKRLGYTNWIMASRILALGPHSLQTAGTFALLIALEIILPADNWQQRHEMGPHMDSALLIMEKGIRKKGFVHWRDETGTYFKDQLQKNLNGNHLGWVSAGCIREFLGGPEGAKPSAQDLIRPPSQDMKEASSPMSNRAPHMDPPEQLTLPF